MKLIPRNGVFYIHFVDSAGYRKRISTGTSDEALANVKAVEIMREHMVETLPDAQRKKLALTITVAGAIATSYEKIWASQRGAREKRYTIGKIAREIGQWPLQRVTFARLQDWADDAIKAGRSPATMNRHLPPCTRHSLWPSSAASWMPCRRSPTTPRTTSRSVT